MRTRLTLITLTASLLVLSGFSLLACDDGEEEQQAEAAPMLGLMEVPISHRVRGEPPADAIRIELNREEIRVRGQKVLDLADRGRAPESAVRDHQLPALREAIGGATAATVSAHVMVPYVTWLQVLETLKAAHVNNIHLGVRTLGASPTKAWMQMPPFTVANSEADVQFTGTRPWADFVAHWRDTANACREGQMIDCDGFPGQPEGETGTMRLKLFTRDQALQMTYYHIRPAPPEGEEAEAEEPAPPPAPTAEEGQAAEGEEEIDPNIAALVAMRAGEATFSLRIEEATKEESAITAVVRPTCGADLCQVYLVVDSLTASMRAVSLLSAAFPDGSRDPELVLVRTTPH